MPSPDEINEQTVKAEILRLASQPEAVRDYLEQAIPILRGPSVAQFIPRRGHTGTLLTIRGKGFSAERTGNTVKVGGAPALVIEASGTELRVIASQSTASGPVEVTVGTRTAKGPYDFKVLDYPDARKELDGPPIFFTGTGMGKTGDVPSTGTLNVLVVLVNPSDRVPANANTSRNTVTTAWGNVHTFCDQASFGRLNAHVDVTANWHTLTGDYATYVTSPGDAYHPNIRPAVLDRLMAEAAQAAVDEGFNLDDYAVMACVINLNGVFIRAWGGWSASNFSYNNGAGTNISITTTHDVNLLAIQETANWGRCAHELGHNIVSAPSALSGSQGSATLGEDVYQSDLVDPTVATADVFEMMGSHDNHPLFSAYHMEKLGYYQGSNILNLQWDRNAFSQEYDVVAHGPTENSTGGRYHLIKIQVTPGLCYYIEVRQTPGATTQVFDPNIPLNGAPQQGGVVVTKVFTDVLNVNQQLRFITLLHDKNVLKHNETAADPARALTITVVNDAVVNRPLVCRVRVAWAQGIADDPNGAFDLRMEPWDSSWQTPDIWVDRIPYGAYDQALDAAGRPLGNGDRPRPNEINHMWSRIHCDGTVGATNVPVTFYAINPPGVGDNGNWAPLQTRSINITAGGYTDVDVNWTPVVGQHTCLKVWAGQQLGEITGGNNFAQENVFDFEAPAASVPLAVITPVAVRNPLDRRTLVLITIHGVPRGYRVHFPHAWLWLDAREERKLALAVIPSLDYADYRKQEVPHAFVRIAGHLPRSYDRETPPGVLPGSRMFPIGGITAQVTPKRRVDIHLEPDKELTKGNVMAFQGAIQPPLAGEKVRVDLIDPDERPRIVETSTDAQGRFKAQFDLGVKPSLDAKPKRPAKETPLKGVYQAQAFVVNSPNAAQAESNIVYENR
jgi:hypothetical protein